MYRKFLIILAILAGVMVVPLGASADTVIAFTTDLNTFPNIPPDTGATLTITANGDGTAHFDLLPTTGYLLMPGPLLLNETVASSITFTNLVPTQYDARTLPTIMINYNNSANVDGAGVMNTYFYTPVGESQGADHAFAELTFDSIETFTPQQVIDALTGGSNGYRAAVDLYYLAGGTTGATGWVAEGSVVPIPPTALLLGSGLLGLVLLGRRRKH